MDVDCYPLWVQRSQRRRLKEVAELQCSRTVLIRDPETSWLEEQQVGFGLRRHERVIGIVSIGVAFRDLCAEVLDREIEIGLSDCHPAGRHIPRLRTIHPWRKQLKVCALFWACFLEGLYEIGGHPNKLFFSKDWLRRDLFSKPAQG